MKPKSLSSVTNSPLTMLMVVLMLAGSAAGSGYAVLYRFQGHSDGSIPVYGLVADQAGNLYGVTAGSDFSPSGIFELSPPIAPGDPWVETTLYSFTGGNDGGAPSSGLAFDQAGNLYGTASSGGTFGGGVVYELIPPAQPGGSWTEAVLYSFQNNGCCNGDGNKPYGGVIQDSAGNFYGETLVGGAFNEGTIFQLTPPTGQGGAWTETILHSFNGQDGFFPLGGLLLGRGGALFGTSSGGSPVCGAYGCGLVFKLNPPAMPGDNWFLQVLYEFTGGNDGSGPQSLVADKMRNLYGAAVNGGNSGNGTIFQLTPPSAPGGAWTETVIHSFGGGDGQFPLGRLIFDTGGSLYGTTWNGGQWDEGTVFRLSPPSAPGGAWTETVLHSFRYAENGILPDGLTFGSGGLLYGNTEYGGSYGGFGNGTVFMIRP